MMRRKTYDDVKNVQIIHLKKKSNCSILGIGPLKLKELNMGKLNRFASWLFNSLKRILIFMR